MTNVAWLLVMTTALTAAAVGSLGISGLGWLLPWRHAGEEFLVCRCPRCEQKTRYQAAKAGAEALCPRCKFRWRLPRKPQELTKTASAKVGYSALRRRV